MKNGVLNSFDQTKDSVDESIKNMKEATTDKYNQAADDGLLHIQAQGVKCSNSGEEQPRPTGTEHVDIKETRKDE